MRRTVEPSLKMSQPRLKRQKSGKWAFFRFPNFRITCIIRNNSNQKTEAALLSFCQISGSFCGCYSVCARPPSTPLGILPVMFKRLTYACGGCSGVLQVMLYAMLISSAAVLCRSMHRWLHNKCVPHSCIPPHCQSAPHPRRLLQSTALPTLPDNPHPPTA